MTDRHISPVQALKDCGVKSLSYSRSGFITSRDLTLSHSSAGGNVCKFELNHSISVNRAWCADSIRVTAGRVWKIHRGINGWPFTCWCRSCNKGGFGDNYICDWITGVEFVD